MKQTVLRVSRIVFSLAVLSFSLFYVAAYQQAQSGQLIYADALANGWENWSWATINLNNSSPVHTGATSVSVNAAAWQAFYLHRTTFSTAGYTNLSFWIHGGNGGGQRLQVQATVAGQPQTAYTLAPLAAGSWQKISIPLASLGVANASMDGFWIQDVSGTTQSAFFVDDIALEADTSPTPTPTASPTASPTPSVTPSVTPTPSGSVNIAVDANLNRRAISARIYGVAHASSAQLAELNAPLNRSGGNNTSRYNWQQNADNRGSDWYFQSIPFANQAGETGDTFIQNSRNAGAEPMLTVPMVDYVAKVGPNREKLASFSIAKYGAQTDRDWQWFPDAGNGVWTNGQFVTGNDPLDANVPNSVAFQRGWVEHLFGRWGGAANNGLKYYILDNEYSLWHSTHRDVKPEGARMDEVFARMRDYALMVKSVDPQAKTLGPEEWGWDGYRYSGYDQWYAPRNNWQFPDRAAHGNMDYVAWLLQQFKADEQTRGVRLLDVFTLHYYPQGGEFSNDVSAAMQLRRNRSTRSLWDPNYTDESWINDRVQLVPRMKNWVDQYYPNTKIGLTEYNWGAENHINGATAQADIYGILGREGMDMAARWTTPDAATPTFKAMKMYRNYDGQNSGFGDTSVAASVPNPDNVSAFAAVRSADGALTVMVINKTTSATQVNLTLANFSAGAAAQVWQLTAANQINRLADAVVTGGAVSAAIPAQSITLFVIGAGTGNPPPPPALAAPSNLTGRAKSRTVTLNWQDNSSDEDGFIVERAVAGTNPVFATVGQVSANVKTWVGSTPLGTFVFRVRAARGNVVSDPSNTYQLRIR